MGGGLAGSRITCLVLLPIFFMKSNSYYFSHDYNASNDTKILFLRHQLGMEGYGIYWFLIERLADAGGKLPIELIPVLAMQMQTTDVKVKGVIVNFDLFKIQSGEFWSERLQEHLNLRQKLSQSGKNGALNRWKNKDENGGAIRGAIGEGNAKERKGKEKKEKEIIAVVDEKEKVADVSFTQFGEIDIEILKNELLSNKGQKDSLSMKYRLPNVGDIDKWVETFVIHLKSINITKNTRREFNQHFNNWLGKQNLTTPIKQLTDFEKAKIALAKHGLQ